MKHALLLLVTGLLAGCARPTPPATGQAAATTAAGPTATYTNPVWNEDFADPTIIRAADGFYYAYATETRRAGQVINIQVARSADLVRWDYVGDALPVKPAWASQTDSFWAPHVSEVGGTYYLYFSAKPNSAVGKKDAEAGLCLAVATATSPAGPFTPTAAPLQCGTGFVNIDPMQFDDPATGKRLLYWGSGFGPLKVRELAPDRVSFAPGSQVMDLIFPIKDDDPDNYQKLVEGSWVTYHDGWYYLLFSGDNCCGDKAHYAVMAARSRSATGPFQTLAQATGGQRRTVLARSERWLAPGHNSVVTDAAGQPWLAYHAIDTGRKTFTAVNAEQEGSRRVMLLDRLEYGADGWPRLAATPSGTAQPAPATWAR
ncbi:glycoside hydrolase family 43 protein [uncultured Hymenobacter sp.]|uniref:glycoside hydrolase family 43 protein n=1 Tax=uncultured Hymenobacter sp. TaxID=170016 RepID=UPI0035C9DB35